MPRNLHVVRVCTSCRLGRGAPKFVHVRHPEALAQAFRQQGLKLTPQRQLLFRLLHGNQSHPSAEALYEVASRQMPGISLRTVYQTLTDLAAMGEVQLLTLGPGPQRFDPNTSGHHHARCDVCGTIRDVHVDDVPAMDVRGLDGFRTEQTHIVFAGRCDTCLDG